MDSDNLVEITKTLLEFLEKVGGSVATQAFQIAMKKVYVEAWFGIFLACICIPLFFKGWMLWGKSKKVEKYSEKESLELQGAFLMLFPLIGFLTFLYQGLARLYAPEFYAVQMLMYLFK